MRVATAWSELSDPALALERAYQDLTDRLGGKTPDWVLVTSTIAYDAHTLYEAWQANEYPSHRLHGLSSSRGVMTERGHHGGDERRALALWGVSDEEGAFGIGAASLSAPTPQTPQEAAHAALDQALTRAGRPGQVPQAVWVSTVPGIEEEVLKGIEAYLGDQVLIMGGSAADDDVSGRWQLWSSDGVQAHDVILSVLFPSGEVYVGFQSGYEPTEHHGVVTKAQGRRLIEIDHEPAAQVYNRWSEGALIADMLEAGGNVMAQTSMHPIGRPVNQLHGITYYQLSHPAHIGQDGSIDLFTEFEVDEQVFMMRGTRDSLVDRAGRIGSSLLQIHQLDEADVQGALVIYCAGCMMAIEDRMPSVVDGLSQALPSVPLLGAYTFGEQGCFLGGENRHANMMIAVMLWLDERF